MREMRRQDVWIGGRSLRDLDARIVSVSIEETDNQIEETFSQTPGRAGQRLLERKRIGKVISVDFALREIYDLASRSEIIDAVNGWAAGAGYIEISTRPGKRILAPCRQFATPGTIRDYTTKIRLEFQADLSPFWEDTKPARLTLSGSTASGQLLMRGTYHGLVEASVSTSSGSITSLTVSVTGADGHVSSIALSSISVASGTAIVIGHDANGIFSINAGSTSLLSKRTAASSDELTASPGKATVSITANVAVSAEITGRGRWL